MGKKGRLHGIVEALWSDAIHQINSNGNDGARRGLKCLYAGLSLVLPTKSEARFRLLLAYLLLKYTENHKEASEHVRKSMTLLKAVQGFDNTD